MRKYSSPISHREPPPTAIPIRESRHPGGRKRLKANPSTMPGSVMTSGRMRCSRSMTNNTIIEHAKSRR
jgi:hypothetical protein